MAITQDAMSIEERLMERLDPKAAVEPSEGEEQVQTTDDQQPSETDEVEEVVGEEDESVEDTEVVEDEGEEESDDPWMPEDLDELATAMSVQPDDLKSIRVKTKVDGVEGEATLSEVIKNYQINKSLTERSEAFAKERKAFEEQQEALKSTYEDKVTHAEAMLGVMEERLKAEVTAIDWDQLRMDDPTQYTIKRQDYMEKIGEIENMKTTALSDRETQAKEQAEAQQMEYQKVVQYNGDQLIAKVPEWMDHEARSKGMSELKDYLVTQDISESEVHGIVDYRMILLAKKAKAYDDLQANAAPAKARAKKVPKFTRPGAQKTAAAKKTTDEAKLRQRLRQSGSVNDTAALLYNRLK